MRGSRVVNLVTLPVFHDVLGTMPPDILHEILFVVPREIFIEKIIRDLDTCVWQFIIRIGFGVARFSLLRSKMGVISFDGVTVVVKGNRRVLDNVSGSVASGDLLVVLGPSGSGKTSLLGVLSGEIVSPSSIVRISGKLGYAAQFDRLLPFLTVEETLEYGAMLRGNQTANVEELLQSLDLVRVRSSKVGSTERRGISGGERKRLAVGAELISSPDVLLCDEPTTGLDSVSALAMVRLLSAGLSEVAVVATIHQPSTRLYSLFDKVMVLTKTGSVLYSGRADRAAEVVEELFVQDGMAPPGKGALTPLPPAEFVLEAAAEVSPRIAELAAAANAQQESLEVEESAGRAHESNKSKFWPLLSRAIASNRRSPVATYAACGRSVMMGLVVGLLYSGSAGRDDQKAVSDRTGAIFFVLVNQGYSAIASIRVFLEERVVFEHESRRGAYSTWAYFLSKTIAELPYQILFALVFGGLSYPLAGLRRDWSASSAHAGVLVLATLVAESLALAVGASSPDAKTAVALGPALLSISLLFAGFLVSLDSLPFAARLLGDVSLFRHAFAALLKIEFNVDRAFTCSDSDKSKIRSSLIDAGAPRSVVKSLPNIPCPVPDAKTHLGRILDGNTAPVLTTEIPALLSLFFVFRLFAFFALKARIGKTKQPGLGRCGVDSSSESVGASKTKEKTK